MSRGAAVAAPFYARPTEEVARGLLGRILVSDIGGRGRQTAGRIVEVEAYLGPHDPACHAYNHRRTARTEPLYGPPGTAYVYFTYGMHWCLNAVTETLDFPAAVLIRALEPVAGITAMARRRGVAADSTQLASGPGNLTRALGITVRDNGADLTRGLFTVEPPDQPRDFRISAGPRVGITRAIDRRLRFWIADNPFVSR